MSRPPGPIDPQGRSGATAATSPGAAPLVTLTLWGVRPARVPGAVLRMATDRYRLARAPGVRFAKLLGTGDGRTFTLRDADPLHWGLLACWQDEAAARAAEQGPVHRGWRRLAEETLQVTMRPVHSRGSWARRHPFGDAPPSAQHAPPSAQHAPPSAQHAPPSAQHEPTRSSRPVASITRARLRLSAARSFWRAVPAVSADLHHGPGPAPALAVGIGEAPIGLQGTFSLWHSAKDLIDFAHRRPAHAEVIRRTGPQRWYAEELFARFDVVSVTGTFQGRDPLAGSPPGA